MRRIRSVKNLCAKVHEAAKSKSSASRVTPAKPLLPARFHGVKCDLCVSPREFLTTSCG